MRLAVGARQEHMIKDNMITYEPFGAVCGEGHLEGVLDLNSICGMFDSLLGQHEVYNKCPL